MLLEEPVEGGAQLHGVDGQMPRTGQFEHDDLQEVARPVRADNQDPGWIGFWVHVECHLRVLDRVVDILAANPVPVGRAVDLHHRLVYCVI